MRVVVAIDSFKGSMSSLEAGEAISKGIRNAHKDAEVEIRPLADGGEGTVEALSIGMGGRLINVDVTGPAGKSVNAVYGIVDSSKTAIIEMSQAAGITLVSGDEKNPLYTTTFGVGELIKDAINKGCRHFVVGIGGSATNDCGIGMLQALGYEFLDKEGKQVGFGASGVRDIESIRDENVIKELSECYFRVACDVNNPLCGDLGCSAIYGPQKGATKEMVADMDGWLKSYSKIVKEKYPDADCEYPGTGAAGGLGYAFFNFTNSKLESGIKIVLDETKLEEYVKNADIVVTGEGRLDHQTVMGKAPVGVANIAKKYNKKVIAFSGSVTEDAGVCNEHGIDAFFPILRRIVTLEEAMQTDTAKKNLTDTAEQVFRLL
ncbi:glycerate kinase family protein [Lachnoanaerobaculum sp. OBRC5-5]|uniref:glycerate kinase family protein n=1 Tax=Lachnoanaerobaculum sp. OBRC5-5 TaxID=936595 RepID=UPI00028250B0|nr:glycerate kinase [Lachnoanaerobaculum sp. OBRC5-5]EJZ71351.1 glycerate kinase [Lachnoanaerobaculum sp. OBRC5-5]